MATSHILESSCAAELKEHDTSSSRGRAFVSRLQVKTASLPWPLYTLIPASIGSRMTEPATSELAVIVEQSALSMALQTRLATQLRPPPLPSRKSNQSLRRELGLSASHLWSARS